MYVLRKNRSFVFLAVPVHDMCLVGSDHIIIHIYIGSFREKFGIHVSDSLDLFLGMALDDSVDSSKLHNSLFIEQMF